MADDLEIWQKRIEETSKRRQEIKDVALAQIFLVMYWLAFLYLAMTNSYTIVFLYLLAGGGFYLFSKHFQAGANPDNCEEVATEITRLKCLIALQKKDIPLWWVDDDGKGVKQIEIYDAEEFSKEFYRNIKSSLEALEVMSPYQREKERSKARKSAKFIYDEMNQLADRENARPICWMTAK
jgi:hypothetical protein